MGFSIRENMVVSLIYTLKDTQDDILEERTPENPLHYIHGFEQILPALEKHLSGKTPGFRTSLRLTAEQAYGTYDPKLVAELPIENFPKGMQLRSGMKFNTIGPDGKNTVIRITEIHENTVTVDGNHPLAGIEVVFDITVQDVRPATDTELSGEEIVGGKSEAGSSKFSTRLH